jgi:hypothetical protein
VCERGGEEKAPTAKGSERRRHRRKARKDRAGKKKEEKQAFKDLIEAFAPKFCSCPSSAIT